MTRIATCLALLAGCGAAMAACPPGQYEVCVTDCICLPEAREVIGPLHGEATRVAAAALQHWLVQAHADARAGGVERIPAAIRARLAPYFDAALLDGVRYRVGDRSEIGTAGAMLNNPDIKAVTLIDIILFRDAQAASADAVLWAHELVHAQQFREWGVAAFARRYTADADSVERPAYAMQFKVAKALREKNVHRE
ncbi:eCIS core domain-containing protein [Pseudomonas sp. Q1-7]|uniref:eCIS core domain-containing protein n=1 Tax=Pseudomonas sp. Q1-7 TaxID=3020843 RepID=UPI0023015FB4|nr:DUF4157 domain-containing protein [Pseudomonas sp. Q1-7]